LGKKRKNRGYSKGSKGRGDTVQCQSCGAVIPRAKAKKVYRRSSLVDSSLAKELRKQGAYIAGVENISYYCVSCAVRLGRYAPRAEEDRRKQFKKKRWE